MKQWEKSKAATRHFAMMRNELRRNGPTHVECTERLPDIGVTCSVICEDVSGRYGLPFKVKLVSEEWSIDGVKTRWVRDDGREIITRVVAWRKA